MFVIDIIFISGVMLAFQMFTEREIKLDRYDVVLRFCFTVLMLQFRPIYPDTSNAP